MIDVYHRRYRRNCYGGKWISCYLSRLGTILTLIGQVITEQIYATRQGFLKKEKKGGGGGTRSNVFFIIQGNEFHSSNFTHYKHKMMTSAHFIIWNLIIVEIYYVHMKDWKDYTTHFIKLFVLTIHTLASKPDLPFIACLHSSRRELRKWLSPARKESILTPGKLLHLAYCSWITNKNWVRVEEAFVGQEIDVVLVIEQHWGRSIVINSCSTCADWAFFRYLLRVALVHGGIYGHQTSIWALSESLTECIAVRWTYSVGTFNLQGNTLWDSTQ